MESSAEVTRAFLCFCWWDGGGGAQAEQVWVGAGVELAAAVEEVREVAEGGVVGEGRAEADGGGGGALLRDVAVGFLKRVGIATILKPSTYRHKCLPSVINLTLLTICVIPILQRDPRNSSLGFKVCLVARSRWREAV